MIRATSAPTALSQVILAFSIVLILMVLAGIFDSVVVWTSLFRIFTDVYIGAIRSPITYAANICGLYPPFLVIDLCVIWLVFFVVVQIFIEFEPKLFVLVSRKNWFDFFMFFVLGPFVVPYNFAVFRVLKHMKVDEYYEMLSYLRYGISMDAAARNLQMWTERGEKKNAIDKFLEEHGRGFSAAKRSELRTKVEQLWYDEEKNIKVTDSTQDWLNKTVEHDAKLIFWRLSYYQFIICGLFILMLFFNYKMQIGHFR